MIAATLLATAAAAGGAPDGPTVAIPGRFFAPRDVAVVVGQSVTWRNDDATIHNVRSLDAGADSGRMAQGATYTFGYERTGRFEYLCTIHRYMRGTVQVDLLGLDPPAAPTPAGGTAALTGTAPAGTGTVTLERLSAAGAWEPVAEGTPDAAGRFRFDVPAEGPARYRARSDAALSREVALAVAPRLTITARRVGGRVRATVAASPAQAGARVVLERYVLERFGWVRLRVATLRADSTAVFGFRTRGVALRARLARPVGGWATATSAVARVGRARAPVAHDHGGGR